MSIRNVAYGASFIDSYSLLKKRDFPVSEALISQMEPWVRVCSDNLNAPPSTELLSESLCATRHLQKRALQPVHESNWLLIFSTLDSRQRVRYLEGTEPFARGWLHAIPAFPQLTLENYQVEYGLRRALLLDVCPRPPPCRTCVACGGAWSQYHHLSCSQNIALRTFRHHALRDALARFMDDMAEVVLTEQTAGCMQHDILFEVNKHSGKYGIIDVTVVTPNEDGPAGDRWPLPCEVEEAVERAATERAERFAQRGADPPVRQHRNIEIGRFLRRMARVPALEGRMVEREESKRRHFTDNFTLPDGYNDHFFIPFVLTSGGGANAEVTKVKQMIKDDERGEIPAKKAIT